MAPKPERCSILEVTPSLANSPSARSIWQRPQMPRPPQTESISTPRLRAACSRGVPMANRPRRPDGMKTTRASGLSAWTGAGRTGTAAGSGIRAGSGTAAPALALAPGAFLPVGQGLAEFLDPAHAIHVMAHGHVGAQDPRHLLGMQRVGDGRGHARPDQHRQERGVEAVAI